MVDYYVDEDGTLHVLLDGEEIGSESDCDGLSKQAIRDIVNEILEEYGYL